jgi:ribonuclease R
VTLSDSAILKKIEHQPKRTAGFKQLVRELGLRGDARRDLSERLNRLVADGQLIQVDSERYTTPQASSGRNTLVGRLSLHRDGFGFVIPDQSSLDPKLKARITSDIFIPPPAVGTAMHGDQVLVEITTFRPDGRAEGRILRPVNRANPTIVGTFHYAPRGNYVTPIDSKVAREILISPGMEYPEGFSPAKPASTDRVLGKEVARRADLSNLEGVIVDVEITDWPTATRSPRGRVVEIVGYEDDFGVDVEIMIRKHHLPHHFPQDVLTQAQNTSNTIPRAELPRRRDFRQTQIVTIDGETARDFDDAVTVCQLENGNYELQVHIADVSHYVTPDSPIDHEARLRGTSVYFPDRAVPMLPLELSTDICSLRPKVDRLVTSCIMEIDHRGEIAGVELCEGIICSAERMTYTAVNAAIEGDATARERYAPLVTMFEMMRDLALILNRKRQKRGSIDFDLPEAVIEFDDLGLMKSITRSERNIAHRLIEEFMLAANECVATYLEKKLVASIYRIHEKPDAKRVYDFEVLAAAFGYSLGVGALPIERIQLKADRRSNYGTGKRAKTIEVPKEVHITPRMYQKLTEKIAGKPEERILSYLMLRSLKQARYSEKNEGHFALAAPSYTHFTSPIRRYPDLIVHRILKAVLRDSAERHHGDVPVGTYPLPLSSTEPGKPDRGRHDDGATPWSKRREKQPVPEENLTGPIPLEELHDIAEDSSHNERRAADAERELLEWKKTKFMQDHIGDEFDGLITSVTKFGFFVELAQLFVEGLVPLNSLIDDRYVYHENTREIIGQHSRKIYGLGQKIRVMVERIDPVEKKIQFSVLEEVKTPKRPKRPNRLRV